MKRKGKNNIEKSQVCQAHIDKSMIKHDRKTIKVNCASATRHCLYGGIAANLDNIFHTTESLTFLDYKY